MSKILVLAEKPSVGRELARVLGCRKSADGHIIGDNYIVTWALGHLVTLAEPERYGDQYKTWSLDVLPMLPNKMDLCVIPQTSKQYNIVKTLLHSNEVSSLIIATDAGREGELVARWIIEKAGFNKPIKRLWISSQTDKAITQGFSNLKDGKEYINLYNAAVSRAEADWLVGLNVTRALTCKHNAQLSAGRVQTPTLSLIIDKENEIRNFKSKDYYNVNADLGNFFATYRDDKNQSSIFDKSVAESIVQKVKGKPFKIFDIKLIDKRTPPPALYDLTELQRDANKIYQFSAKQTLNIMQRLYENYKALTYPRTDSRYLTDDIIPTLNDRLKAVSMGDFIPLVKECKTITKSCINNAKVSDHHAIIPTEQKVDMTNLNTEEKRIYMLVVKRFLANFYPDYAYRQITTELMCENAKFYATGREILNQGWKKVYTKNEDDSDNDENEQILPGFKHGDTFLCKNTQLKALKTLPPPRYTEASLLSAMENPSKFIVDTKMKEFIGSGLGTPATRADIIEKLFSSFYLEKQGNSLIPTAKATQLITLVPSDLKEPLLTATWEKQLEAISKGQVDKNNFINDIKKYTTELVKKVSSSENKFIHENITREVCPECGKFLLSVNGKKGKMLVCQDRDCSYRKNVMFKSNVRCPNCHKTMEVFGDGDKRTYVCKCGFRDKVDNFHKNKTDSGVSKSFVKDYLKSQNMIAQKPEESAFAAALKKAMKDDENH